MVQPRRRGGSRGGSWSWSRRWSRGGSWGRSWGRGRVGGRIRSWSRGWRGSGGWGRGRTRSSRRGCQFRRGARTSGTTAEKNDQRDQGCFQGSVSTHKGRHVIVDLRSSARGVEDAVARIRASQYLGKIRILECCHFSSKFTPERKYVLGTQMHDRTGTREIPTSIKHSFSSPRLPVAPNLPVTPKLATPKVVASLQF